ncbi:MAG: DUF2828 family protein, partial [Oscillospiraceae bacterium]|nr:DUF2828 family protein [Oscillospiraceae bacterium]
MLQYLKQEANRALTENGAATYATTQSDCLDLFATIGAMRSADEQEILARFQRAFAEDRDLAMKTLFFARDVRGGLGERRVFRTILPWLAQSAPESLKKNLPLVAEYGRWDDLLCLLGTPCEDAVIGVIRRQLEADRLHLWTGEPVSLLAKWLPSVNASNRETVLAAKRIARKLGMRDAEYRKLLSELRRTIDILENHLRTQDYTFPYEAQPSKALLKYRAAFRKHDGERYQEYLYRVSIGKANMNTGTLTPYDIIAPFYARKVTPEERRAIDVTWNAQEDHTGNENALVVADGSGSMYWNADPKPAAVAQSLAIYYAERNHGAFHNHFITFSMHPQLVEIKGSDILEKAQYCASYNECANTNLQAVFELILDAAVENHLPQSELPAKLYIISDMEFDVCMENSSLTNFERAKALYQAHGYTLPQVVFWNVSSRSRQQPVTMNEQGVALI